VERSGEERDCSPAPAPIRQAGKKQEIFFFQSQPPQRSMVTCFGHKKRMHANENNTLPTGMDAEIMKSFVEIAKKTGQLSEIMEFPPINHDSPIRYVLSYT
jgi:hypothetical protein